MDESTGRPVIGTHTVTGTHRQLRVWGSAILPPVRRFREHRFGARINTSPFSCVIAGWSPPPPLPRPAPLCTHDGLPYGVVTLGANKGENQGENAASALGSCSKEEEGTANIGHWGTFSSQKIAGLSVFVFLPTKIDVRRHKNQY